MGLEEQLFLPQDVHIRSLGVNFWSFDGLFWAPWTRLRSFEVHLRLLVVNCWPLSVNLGLNESTMGVRVDIGYLGIILEL